MDFDACEPHREHIIVDLLNSSHFKQFLNLIETFVVKDSAGADRIAKYEDSYVRPALVATFSIGRLESKFIVGHPREQLENLEKSKKHYDYVSLGNETRLRGLVQRDDDEEARQRLERGTSVRNRSDG